MLDQLFALFILALVVACVSWTVTHEEILREPRDWLSNRCHTSDSWLVRKLCYIPTCEYCFSHWIGALVVAIAGFQLLFADWRGYLVGWLSIVAISNVYMSAFGHLRVEIHKDRAEIQQTETEIKARQSGESMGEADGIQEPKRFRA